MPRPRSQELYRCNHGELWRRQIGEISPSAFAHRIGGCQDLLQRLELYTKLDEHTGCVNTVSFSPGGDVLVSGSDDRQIVLWDWFAKRVLLSYYSGHESNVFQARVMPFSDDRSLVSCAADGQVRHGLIKDDGTVHTKKLARHQGRAHKLAVDPGSSRLFYSCGEDGVVRHFDLRCSKSMQLLTCLSFGGSGSRTRRRAAVVRLNAIVMNPLDARYFAVGGSDEYARVYDVRKPCARAGGADGPVNAFTPRHLAGSDQVHITCVAYSLQEELLASYNDEHIYLFGKAMGLGPDPCRDGSSALDRDASEDEEEEQPQVYMGHRNAQTVKGVSFFGPNTEYVVSGSDCGRIFIWKKKGGQLVALRVGDEQIVNCLEPHPFATVLATSGIDRNIKIWMPTASEALPLPDDATQVMEMNKSGREEQAPFALTPDIMIHLLRLHRRHSQRQRMDHEDDTEEDEKAGEADSASDESQDSSSQECIIS